MNKQDYSASVSTSNPSADTMKKKLSKALKALIKRYIDNCAAQSSGQKWDKNADVLAIEVQAKLDGFINTESCCGTWWFNYRRGKSRWVFEVDESNYTIVILGKKCIPSSGNSHALNGLFGVRA